MASKTDLKAYLKQRGYNEINHLDKHELLRLIDSHQNGGSIFSRGKEIITRAKAFITGARKSAPPVIKELLSKYGDNKILTIKVCREPIQSLIRKALNVISFGQFEKNLSKYIYDDLFHLYLVLTIENGDKVIDILMEKNQTVNVKINSKPVGDCFIVPYNSSSNLTINKLITNGEKLQGDTYWVWSVDNNCQVFVMNTLKGSNLYTSKLNDFVLQCASCVINGKLKSLANGVVDFASRADILLHGKGINRKRAYRGGMRKRNKF